MCVCVFSTARVWKDGRSIELPGEHKYGVEVCALETGEIVTGSFKVIHIIKFGKVTKTIREAHNRAFLSEYLFKILDFTALPCQMFDSVRRSNILAS